MHVIQLHLAPRNSFCYDRATHHSIGSDKM